MPSIVSPSASNIDHKLRLVYFDGRGRAETIRLLFAYAQIPYEDKRVPDMSSWESLKPTIPLGQLPIVELLDKDGNVAAVRLQSGTIIREYASKYGLAGKTRDESFAADEAYEVTNDIAKCSEKLAWQPSTEGDLEKLKSGYLPVCLKYLESKLEQNGGKFISGGQNFTYGDFAIASTIYNLTKPITKNMEYGCYGLPVVLSNEELEAGYPGLAALKKAVEEAPGIKEYLAKRPDADF